MALSVMCALAVGATAVAQPLGFDQAISAASADNLQAKVGQLRVDEAAIMAEQAGARYLPILRVEANTMVWDDEVSLNLGGGGGAPADLPEPMTPYEAVLAGLLTQLGEPVTVREQLTAEVQVSVIQPLGQLYKIHLADELSQTQVDVARLEQALTQEQITRGTSAAYLQWLLLDQLLDNARVSLDELLAQEKRVKVLVDNDVALPADVLRLGVAIADARKEVIRLENGRQIAGAQLTTLMNRDFDPNLELEPLSEAQQPPPAPRWSQQEAVERALAQRVQLSLAQKRAEQAGLGLDLAQSGHLPDVNLIGSYLFTEGQGLNAPNQAFIGLFLAWNVFEWGATQKEVEAAQIRVSQAQMADEAMRQGVELEVRQAWLELDSARKAWTVADSAVAQAQEVYRTEKVRYDQGATTAVDLLSTQAALTQARGARHITWYQALLASVNLCSAMGEPISAAAILP